MKSFTLKIPPIGGQNNLTIIYKEKQANLYEIKTSKEDILRALRYYQNKQNEINLMNLIYIEENVPFDIFNAFISSIKTQEIDINEKNYKSLLYLSEKYQFHELQSLINGLQQSIPNDDSIIKDIIISFSENQFDASKEEIIAKNLDICIKNGYLSNFPIQILIRIINSPKRTIQDHHLLFEFIISILKSRLSQNLSDEEIEYLLILPSCLDFNKMTNSEIEQLFEIEKSKEFFLPRNTEEKMTTFISNEKEMRQKLNELEEKIEKKHLDQIEMIQKVHNDELDQQKEFYLQKQDELLKRIEKMESFINNSNIFNNISPLKMAGDLLTHNGENNSCLPIGNPEQILTVNSTGTNPEWKTLGTLSTQDADNVNITGGNITSLSTPLPVASGGTELNTIGTTSQVLSVNQAANELEYHEYECLDICNLKASLANGTDLNDIINPGTYWMYNGGTAVNRPSEITNNSFRLVVKQINRECIEQELTRTNPNNHYTRVYIASSGTWTEWKGHYGDMSLNRWPHDIKGIYTCTHNNVYYSTIKEKGTLIDWINVNSTCDMTWDRTNNCLIIPSLGVYLFSGRATFSGLSVGAIMRVGIFFERVNWGCGRFRSASISTNTIDNHVDFNFTRRVTEKNEKVTFKCMVSNNSETKGTSLICSNGDYTYVRIFRIGDV